MDNPHCLVAAATGKAILLEKVFMQGRHARNLDTGVAMLQEMLLTSLYLGISTYAPLTRII